MTIADKTFRDEFPSAQHQGVLASFTTQSIAQIILFVVVLLLVGGPLLVLLRTSFLPDGAVPLASAEVTLNQYQAVVTGRGIIGLLRNTLIYSACSVLMGVSLASIFAWFTERTDMPLRIVVRVLMFSWMTVPPIVIGYGWILLINPSNGALNVFLRNVLGYQDALFSPFTMTAMIFINGLAIVPTAFVMISGLLRNMDPKLEDAAIVLGVSRWTTLRRVTLPLLTPGIVSIGIFLTMATIQSFDLPLLLGMTAQVPVLSTRIYTLSASESGISNYGLAAVYGNIFLLLAVLLMWIYFRTTRMSERYWVVSGKAFQPRRLTLGIWRFAAFFGIGTYFFLMTLPILILLWTSLFPFYRVPSFSGFGEMSLAAYARVFEESMVKRAIFNTVLLFFVSATITIFIAGLVSWYSVRSKGILGKILDMLAFSPMAVPPIVMGMAILVIYLRTPLYGTVWVLIIGNVTVFLPFATRSISSGLSQIHKELENAADISGASWWTNLRRIILPMLLQQIINAWLWIATHAARDLTFPLLLMTTNNVVLASAIYLMWNYPDVPGASALAIMLLVGLTAVAAPIQIFAARQIERTG